MGNEVKNVLEESAIDAVTERLSILDDIYLPHSIAVREETTSRKDKQMLLADLLRRDAAVFLERYGRNLDAAELALFEPLKGDYEVAWHVRALTSALNPTAQDQRSQLAIVKNRRLAFMNQLMQEGQYFSDDTMRMRAPLLHHEYVGKFEDPAVRAGARADEKYSETLFRQTQELEFQRKLREERVRAGIPVDDAAEEDDFVEEEDEFVEEEDEEEEEEEEEKKQETFGNKVKGGEENTSGLGASQAGQSEARESASDKSKTRDSNFSLSGHRESNKGQTSGTRAGGTFDAVSEEEKDEKKEDFMRIMQEKFLQGDDKEYMDYAKIDADSSLDDHWLPEMSRDAENKYFDED